MRATGLVGSVPPPPQPGVRRRARRGRQLDEDRFAQRLEAQARLEIVAIGDAQPLVGGAQALAGGGGGPFRGGQPVAFGGVRGIALGQGPPRRRLSGRGLRELRLPARPARSQGSRPLLEPAQLAVGPSDPFLADPDRRLGP